MGLSKKGMERVLTAKNYAYLMESATIDYYVKRNCTLRRVGKLLDDKGYAIYHCPKVGHLSKLCTQVEVRAGLGLTSFRLSSGSTYTSSNHLSLLFFFFSTTAPLPKMHSYYHQ